MYRLGVHDVESGAAAHARLSAGKRVEDDAFAAASLADEHGRMAHQQHLQCRRSILGPAVNC